MEVQRGPGIQCEGPRGHRGGQGDPGKGGGVPRVMVGVPGRHRGHTGGPWPLVLPLLDSPRGVLGRGPGGDPGVGGGGVNGVTVDVSEVIGGVPGDTLGSESPCQGSPRQDPRHPAPLFLDSPRLGVQGGPEKG